MTHTPTPWKVDKDADGEYTIRGAGDQWIANNTSYYPSAPNDDDAEFIVTAVNAFEANQARIAELEKALRPFADFADALNEELPDNISIGIFADGAMRFGPSGGADLASLRAARAALSPQP